MRVSERLYQILLKAYPARYRFHYEALMAQLFSDQLRQVNGRLGLMRLWRRTLIDLLRTVPVQHLERLLPHSGNRYGEAVRRCLFFARYEAEGLGSNHITPEHVLLGVLRQDLKIRGWLNPSALDNIRHEIQIGAERSRGVSGRTHVPLSSECKRILASAVEEADKAGRKQIAPRDLVAGILREEQTLAAALLARHRIDFERLRSFE